jgi:ornithine cyclodeaminase/alanine dehydrogenase-like protein (mu-crystallin family)
MPSDARLLLLNKDQVERLILADDVLKAVREAFVLHSRGEGRVFPTVREHLDAGGIFGIKSGDIPDLALLGFKAGGFWPSNRRIGGEPHQATVVLIDPANGRPLCIIDGNAITTVRTGAVGGLGVVELARPDSVRACVFGTGVQARAQLTFALQLMPSLRAIRYVTSSGLQDTVFESYFAGQCEISLAPDRNAAVAESDVVITATPGAGALFELGAVQPGTHFNCVGADTKGKRELPEGLLERARLFVDDRVQAQQIGETQWAPDQPCTEFGELLSGTVRADRNASDITIFDMTGLALQDLTVARLVHDRAVARGMGIIVAWPW